MRQTIVLLAVTLVLAAGGSVAQSKTVTRFPYKGAPYAVQVPDQPSVTVSENLTKGKSAKPERRDSQKKPNELR